MLAEPKVSQLEVASAIEQNILRLQVSVDNLFGVEVFDGQDEFSNVETCLILRKNDFSGQVETEIATRAVVQCQVEVVRSLERIMEINNKWVVGLFQNVGFYDGVLELLLDDQVFLLEGLEGVLFAAHNVLNEKHFPKGSRTQNLDDVEGCEVNFVGGYRIELILVVFSRAGLFLCALLGSFFSNMSSNSL